jgi:hypothetical protein
MTRYLVVALVLFAPCIARADVCEVQGSGFSSEGKATKLVADKCHPGDVLVIYPHLPALDAATVCDVKTPWHEAAFGRLICLYDPKPIRK